MTNRRIRASQAPTQCQPPTALAWRGAEKRLVKPQAVHGQAFCPACKNRCTPSRKASMANSRPCCSCTFRCRSGAVWRRAAGRILHRQPAALWRAHRSAGALCADVLDAHRQVLAASPLQRPASPQWWAFGARAPTPTKPPSPTGSSMVLRAQAYRTSPGWWAAGCFGWWARSVP